MQIIKTKPISIQFQINLNEVSKKSLYLFEILCIWIKTDFIFVFNFELI